MLEKVPRSLRGELSRWMIEPKAGVFVGKMSAAVREMLWEKAVKKSKGGGCIQVYPAQCEQGFAVRMWGDTSREIVDMEGLTLVKIQKGS